MNVLSTIKTAWNTTKFFVIKNAPTILTIAGMVSTVAGTFFACKSTLKLPELMGERDAEKAAIEEAHEKGLEGYSEQDYKKDLLKCKTTTVKELAKLYWVPATCTALGVAGILSGHGMMRSRNAAIGAALVATERAFNGYRERVKGFIGEEEEAKIRFPMNEVEVTHEVPDAETGEIVLEKSTQQELADDPRRFSPYAFWFDHTCPGFTDDSATNIQTVHVIQNQLDHKYESRGYLFLNEIRAAFGKPATRIGGVAGLKKGMGDEYVDLGVMDKRLEILRNPGDDILIIPNCCGDILSTMPDEDVVLGVIDNE